MNIVALHAVRRNGIEYPWSYSIWKRPETQTDKEGNEIRFGLADASGCPKASVMPIVGRYGSLVPQ